MNNTDGFKISDLLQSNIGTPKKETYSELGGNPDGIAEKYKARLEALSQTSLVDMLVDLMGQYLKRSEMEDFVTEYEGKDQSSEMPEETMV